jgi:hypothetical protein
MEQYNATGAHFTLVHFTYEDELGIWRLGCMPGIEELHATQYHPNYQRTNDPRAVKCPACEKSGAYRDAAAKLREARL